MPRFCRKRRADARLWGFTAVLTFFDFCLDINKCFRGGWLTSGNPGGGAESSS
jgi:hypothetical protein